MAQPVWQFTPLINTFGGDLSTSIKVTPAATTFPVANDAIFVPFYLHQATLIKRLFCSNGTVVSGNVDVGIYTEDGALIVSSGSVAHAGTSDLQFFDVTDIVLGPGRYYMAIAMDNTTGTIFRANLSVSQQRSLGMAKQASAFPLPASATLAVVTSGFLPLIGAEIRELF